jgi:serine/threonine protein kinase
MIRRHSAPMALTSPQQFLAALRTSRLFSADQLTQLEAEHANEDVSACMRKMVERKWLTEYQAEQVLSGFGEGLVLGQYRILDRLGEGGMAQVYRAEHILMKRTVAMKVIAARPWSDLEHGFDSLEIGWHSEEAVRPPGTAAQIEQGDPGAIDRFHHEVRIAAQLDHPNIVRAHDAAEARGLYFLVMEFVDGIDLSAHVAQGGPLPVAVACDYVRQAALGLQYAHERGLVHRDIKPSNLLVTKTGLVKILDLGLARLAGAIPRDAGRSPNGSDVSGLAGTPDYMAPETAQDSRCHDIRSDLYSLGCTFYFLLTSQVPFPGGGWPEKLLRHQLDSAPSVVVVRPDVPNEIAVILQRLMAKDPGQRYATPAELAADLDTWLTANRASADPVLVLPAATTSATSVPTVSMDERTPVNSEIRNPKSEKRGSDVGFRITNIGFLRGRLAAACIIGLVAALLLRGSVDRLRKPTPHDAGRASSSSGDAGRSSDFTIEGNSERFRTLSAAVASASDGAVIMIEGDGPYQVQSLRLAGKALTLRAGDGYRPRILFIHEPDAPPWQPLLAADRPLRLEGLELVYAAPANNSATDPAHLVYVEKAALTMRNCVVHSPHGSASVVCRDCREVSLDGCRLTAAALALCVETAGSGTTVRLHATHVNVEAPGGAALSLWASENGRVGTLRLELESCTVQAARVIAIGLLPNHIYVNTRHDHFAFRDALLSYASSPDPGDWRRATTWQEVDNTYETSGGWLSINGVQHDVSDAGTWHNLWNPSQSRTPSANQAAPATSAVGSP